MDYELIYYWIYNLDIILICSILAIIILFKSSKNKGKFRSALLVGGIMMLLNPINRVYELIYSILEGVSYLDNQVLISDFTISCTYIFAFLTLILILRLDKNKIVSIFTTLFSTVGIFFVFVAIVTAIPQIFWVVFMLMSVFSIVLAFYLFTKWIKESKYKSSLVFSIAMLVVGFTDFIYLNILLFAPSISNSYGWLFMASYPVCYVFMALGLLNIKEEVFDEDLKSNKSIDSNSNA
ncbi:MAG: hypothetical protein LBM96_03535 [Methanobrevibacter sp.]|jgi:hypothetical protein|nr:hypothetical protein [Candidatus Methanoflexus mossambicus]